MRISDSAIQRDRESSRLRYHRNRDQNRKVQKAHREYMFDTRPFIGWDGEGYSVWHCTGPTLLGGYWTHHYMLFGASTGDCVTGPDLGTTECLQLILDVEKEFPDAYHVGFAFEYDVNMILKDLPWRTLAILREHGKCRWADPTVNKRYRIEHIPHKWFRVTCDGVSATIYDAFGFFHCSYMSALTKYNIGSEAKRAHIASGKAKRANFTYKDLPAVKAYWSDEISLLPPLLDAIRAPAYRAGYRISEWHGPGALASYLLRDVGVTKWHSKEKSTPPEVRYAIRAAYAGGRFTGSQCGLYIGDVYTADLNSAYIYAASLLPRMDRGTWLRQNYDNAQPRSVARFGIYHIEFDGGSEHADNARKQGLSEPPYPLFHRSKNGVLRWPRRCQGWYWSPEAALVIGDSRAKVLEAWVWDDDKTYPFRFVHDAFARRLELQRQGDAAEKMFKWALAAMYGAFARRVGWNRQLRKAPPSHELAWAGFITSWCRANVWGPAMSAYIRGKGRGLISIDTDGVTATVPFRPEDLCNGVGENLGEWKLEKWTGILQWQNGIYWLRDDNGEWKDPKSRGIPKGTIPFDTAYKALAGMDFSKRPFVHPTLRIVRTRFVGYSQALRGQFQKWRRWVTEPVNIIMGGNPLGKAFHFYARCQACRNGAELGTLESLHTITVTAPSELRSHPHKLPWLEDQPYYLDGSYRDAVNLIVKDDTI